MNATELVQKYYPNIGESAIKVIDILAHKHQTDIKRLRETLMEVDECIRDNVDNYSKYKHSPEFEISVIIIMNTILMIESIENVYSECENLPPTREVCRIILASLADALHGSKINDSEFLGCAQMLASVAAGLPTFR